MKNKLELVFFNRSTLLEGPSWDSVRNGILCVSIEQNCIYYIYLDTGEIKTFELDSQVGCAVFEDKNTILAAAYSGIYRIDFNSGKKSFVTNINEESMIRYNDGKLDSKGRFLVGTTGYKCFAENKNYLYSFENGESRVLVEGTSISNGIAFSKDEQYMYFVDTPTNVVARYLYDISTGNVEYDKDVVTIADGVPDGIYRDIDDMLWVAQWGGNKVSKWNPYTGDRMEEIEVPCLNVTSCCLGGYNNEFLYITTAQHDDGTQSEMMAGGLFRIRIR